VWGLFGVAAVVTLGVVYGLVQRWGLPAWTLGLAVGLLAVGAGVLVATGRYEQRRRAARPTPAFARLFTWRNAALGGGLAAAGWVVLALALVFRGPGAHAANAGGVRLAVLPFANRGAPEDAYFADGIADEMRGKLAGLGGFQITARSSSEQYRDNAKPPQEIGRELGVDYLLSATVRWAKSAGGTSRVQVVPELIDARTGGVTWQQTFEADLTDVFQVQAQIASRVAGAVGVALGGAQQQQLEARPTDNLAAYDLYLKGKAVMGVDPTSLREQATLLEQAVALDSTFTEAWAALSRSLSLFYTNGTPDPVVATRARQAAERAIALDGNASDGYASLAAYHRIVSRDPALALEQITQALRRAPNDPEILAGAAAVERAIGRWDEALAHLQQARRLDPRSWRIANGLQVTLLWMRRYSEALTASEAALALAPGELSISQDKAMIYVAQGDLAGARAVIREISPAVPPPALAAFFGTYWDMSWVLEEDAQQLLLRLAPAAFDNDRVVWASVLMQTSWLRGDTAKARAFADSALGPVERQLRQAPDPNRHLVHGLALAYLGRKAEAIAAGERAVALVPLTRDGQSGPYYQHQLARIYLAVGERDKALDLLEPLLGIPYFLSPGWLRVDPTLAQLRGHPRFERLIAGG